MILSNTAILEAINKGALTIEPLAGRNPSDSPFNTSAVDLRLGTEILRPKADQPIALDLRRKGISLFLHQHCVSYPGMFICQLIIEEVRGSLIEAPNQFRGQSRPAGVVTN